MPLAQGNELTARLSNNLRQRTVSSDIDLVQSTQDVLSTIGASIEDSGGNLSFYGADPIVRSVLRVGSMPAIALAAKAVMIAKIWKMRTGQSQDIHVDVRKALHRFAGFGEMRWIKMNGNLPLINADPDNPLTPLGPPEDTFLPTKDGGFVTTSNFYPRARDRVFKLLKCMNTLEAVKAAVKTWNAEDLDQAAAEARVVLTRCRRLEDALQLEVYQTLKDMPLIRIDKVADSAPIPFTDRPTDPLTGVRALGMAHTVAGPSMGSALALHGADVMNVWRPLDYEPDVFLWASHLGTRSTVLDIDQPEPRAKFDELVRGSDVFYINRRASLVERYGLGYRELCAKKPGLIHAQAIYATESGPWSNRVGYDVTTGAEWGLFNLEGSDDAPRESQIKIVNDYVSGWLATVGILEALRRRSSEGGSYRVLVSLTRVSLWLLSLGIFDKDYVNKMIGSSDEHTFVDPDLFTAETPCGSYQGLTEQVYMMRTPGAYHTTVVPRGSSKPVWL